MVIENGNWQWQSAMAIENGNRQWQEAIADSSSSHLTFPTHVPPRDWHVHDFEKKSRLLIDKKLGHFRGVLGVSLGLLRAFPGVQKFRFNFFTFRTLSCPFSGSPRLQLQIGGVESSGDPF